MEEKEEKLSTETEMIDQPAEEEQTLETEQPAEEEQQTAEVENTPAGEQPQLRDGRRPKNPWRLPEFLSYHQH